MMSKVPTSRRVQIFLISGIERREKVLAGILFTAKESEAASALAVERKITPFREMT